MGNASRMGIQDKIQHVYMSCTNKNNMVILFELIIMKSNYLQAELKYKSESGSREVEFENFITILLSDIVDSERCDDIKCR